jgi:hypothetical protein
MSITIYEGASERTRKATEAFNAAQAKSLKLKAQYNTLVSQMQSAKAEAKAAYTALEQAWEADKASK